jgi:hypothetical protein
MQHDVFICHASEDKEDFVRPLATLLEQQHINVWYDEFSLGIGDSLSQKIDEGLSKSRFGIVVLSKNFFNKPWTKRELTGLVQREMIEQRDVILPIWHRVTVEEVAHFSLPLADKKAVSSSAGINAVIRALTEKINPNPSPLVVARDYLTGLGITPPSISDEWWLDVIEYKEFLKYPDLNSQKRWIFPLPYDSEDRGRERGLNIASTALQIDWSFEGEELNIGPTTHPDIVHEFIRRWPGLYDCARSNPEILALYVPQLTIPGFDYGFEDVFDEVLYAEDKRDSIFSYGKHSTVDNQEPLCMDIIALRHPSFGNYTVNDIAHWYFYAHNTSYMRSNVDTFEGLIWLLSDQSDWLPTKYRETFLSGIKMRDRWVKDVDWSHNAFFSALVRKPMEQFKLTPSVKNGLKLAIEDALKNLSINEASDVIAKRFLGLNIIESYYTYEKNVMERRNRKG